MKTRKNRHTRNRTSRRRMKGGGHAEDIKLIKDFLVPIPADLIAANQGQKFQSSALDNFLDGIVPREQHILEFQRLLKEYPISAELGEGLKVTLAEINAAKIRRRGKTSGQAFYLPLAQRFQSELAQILPIVEANPQVAKPASVRKQNVDWFPSLQTLHRIAKDYAILKKPTEGARINAQFTTALRASEKDEKEGRKDYAEDKLLKSIAKFSDGILSTWFDKIRGIAILPSAYRAQAAADIRALVPRDMPEKPATELENIFEKHTAFLAENKLELPPAPRLVTPDARPGLPGRKGLPLPTSDDAPVAILAPPLPPSAPESPVLTGELQAPPKELDELPPTGPAPGLGIPESAPLAAAVARRGVRGSNVGITSTPLAPTPSFGTSSAPAPQFPSPGPKPLPVPQYTPAALPGPTDVERGALVAASKRARVVEPRTKVEGEVPVYQPLPSLAEGAPPAARRSVTPSQPTRITSAAVAATPDLPAFGTSAEAAPILSPGPREKVAPQYIPAELPGPTDVERGAVPSPSKRAPLQAKAKVEGEVPVHEPLPSLEEGVAPPPRVPVKEPGLFDGLTSLLPSFLSTPAPASQLGATPALSNVSKPGISVVPEYVAEPGPSVSKELQPLGEFPAVAPLEPSPPTPYNPFKSYQGDKLESGPLASPGTYAPSFLNLKTQAPSNTSLATQATPAVPGLKSEEQKAFEKGAYQSIDTSKSLCERLHPRLYEILKTGQYNGKSIFSMINQQDPELTDFFTEIGFDIDDKTLMGHPISEIYKACHPDRTIADPNLTTIFQVLQALYNYTGAVQPVQSIEGVDPDDEYYWADDDPRWDEDDESNSSEEYLKKLIASFQKPKPNTLSLDDVLKSIRQADNLKEIQIQNRKDYIKKHITIFIRQTSERCTDRVLAMRREANMNKLLNFLVDGYPFKVSEVVIQQIRDIIHDEPGKGTKESKTLRFFLDNVVKVIQARNIQELNQRLVAIRQVVHAIFLQEQWCAKPNVALDVKQEIFLKSLNAKWIDETKQGLTLTSVPLRPDKAGGIPPKTITISRGDCFSFNLEGIKTCAPRFVTKESLNHYTVENITEGPAGYALSILRYLSGSVVRSSRFPVVFNNNSAITCFVNGIVKKTCPSGVGLTPQTPDLPDTCPKKLLDAQFKLVASEASVRNEQRRVATCEENLAQVKKQLEAALSAHAAETAKLQGDLGTSKEALRRMEGVKAGLESELARTNRALDLIRNMLGEQTRKLGTLNTRYETLDKQKVKLEGQLADEQGKSAGLEGQLAAEIGTNAEEQGRLQASLAAVTSERADLTQQRGLLRAEIDRQRGELDVLERKAADLETQFASTKALIIQKGDEIRRDLQASVARIDSGLQIINDGVDDVADLVREAKEQIGETRADFVRKINALQRELEASNLQGRQEVLANIGALRFENQQALGALNAGLAAAMAETARLNELLRTETAAKAQAEGALQAAQAAAAEAAAAQARELAAAREASDRAFTAFKEASETASAEERERLTAEAHLAMADLHAQLLGEQAIAVAAANEAARQNLEAQLTALREQIDALPEPYVPPPVVARPLPEIISRTPDGEVLPGDNINIQWKSNGTTGPWILKIFYSNANPDFKDIQAEGEIAYTVKQPGALTGQIFSIV